MIGGLVGHSRFEGSVSSIGRPRRVSTDRTNILSGLESITISVPVPIAAVGEDDCSWSLLRQSCFLAEFLRRKKLKFIVIVIVIVIVVVVLCFEFCVLRYVNEKSILSTAMSYSTVWSYPYPCSGVKERMNG